MYLPSYLHSYIAESHNVTPCVVYIQHIANKNSKYNKSNYIMYIKFNDCYLHIMHYLRMYLMCYAGFICYDDGCHLRKYSRQPKRLETSNTAKLLGSINIVVDKLHMRGHIDP